MLCFTSALQLDFQCRCGKMKRRVEYLPTIDACPFVSAVDPCYSRSTVSCMFLRFTFKLFMGEQSTSFVAVCSKTTCQFELSWSHLTNRERSQCSWLQAALFSQLFILCFLRMGVDSDELDDSAILSPLRLQGLLRGPRSWKGFPGALAIVGLLSFFQIGALAEAPSDQSLPLSTLIVLITRSLKKLHESRYVYFNDTDSYAGCFTLRMTCSFVFSVFSMDQNDSWFAAIDCVDFPKHEMFAPNVNL